MYAGGPGGLNWGGEGLMGNAFQPTAGLMQMPQFQQPQMTQGPWSQLAYQMAGRPNQGPYANVAVPASPPDASGTSGGSALGGTALGLLGSLANNPSALKNIGNLGSSALSKLGGLFGSAGPSTALASSMAGDAAASLGSGASAGMAGTAADVAGSNSAWLAGQPAAGLLGSAAPAAGSVASIMAGGSPALATIGTGAVDAAAASSAADAAAALGGGSAAGSSGSAAGSAAMGAGAGAALAGGIFMAPIIAGMSTPAVRTNAAYNASLLKGLNNPDHNSQDYIGSMQEVVSQIAQGQQNGWGVALPQEIQDKAQQLGLFQAAAAMHSAAQQINSGAVLDRNAAGKTYGVSRNKV